MRLSLVGQLIVVPLVFPFWEADCSVSLKIMPTPSSETVKVNFHVTPYFSALFIDDLKLAESDPSTAFGQHYSHSLPPGQHKVTIESNCCHADEFTISVPRPQTHWAPINIRRRLQLRPAELSFQTDLERFEVWIDGRFAGAHGARRSVTVEVPVEDNGRRAVQILLLHPRLGDHRRRMSLSAGKRTIMRVDRKDFR